MNAVAQVLIDAKERIGDPARWGQAKPGAETWRPPIGTSCAGQAIHLSTGDAFMRRQAEVALCRAAGIARTVAAMVSWNDAPERTHADVMRAFDKAIASVA